MCMPLNRQCSIKPSEENAQTKEQNRVEEEKSTGFELDVSMYAIVSFCRTAHMHIHHEIKRERNNGKNKKGNTCTLNSFDFVGSSQMENGRRAEKRKTEFVGASIQRELPESRCLACAYRKTHRNLMHLKRKIYFSILAVVNFKINMEMGWVFCCANTASQRPDIPNHFIRILDFNVQWLFELLWDDFNVTIDVCLLDFELVWFYFFFLLLFIFFFSHSLYFLLASFSPDKKSATLVELAQQLQWYFLQWNSVTVCLQPHVKHEWNNRYSRFFLYSHTLCVSVFSILLAPFVHIVWLSINFLFLLTLVPFTFRRAFHSTFIIGFDHNLKWDTAVFVELCFCGKRERTRKKIRLFKRPIYILKMFATTLNNPL